MIPISDNKNNEHKNPLSAKKILLFVLYAIIAILSFMAVLSFSDLPSILAELRDMKTPYLLLAILMIIIHLVTFPLSLCLLAKAKEIDVKGSTLFSIAMTEHFFNGITPLASGGQPFQAYCLSKAKVSISNATSLVFANLLMFMFATNGLSLISLIFIGPIMSNIDASWIPVIIIGYTLNFLLVGVTLAIGISSKIRALIMKFVHFLAKFKLFAKLGSQEERINGYAQRFQSSIRNMISKKAYFIFALLSKFFSYMCLYGSSFFLLLALDVPVNITHFPLVMLGTSFAITAVGFFPTPGASGGVEGLARQVYRSIIIAISGGAATFGIVSAQAGSVMLVFRLLSYYMIMSISLIFYIGLEIYFKKQKKKENLQDPDISE